MGRRSVGRLALVASALAAILVFPSGASAATLGETFAPTEGCSGGFTFLQTTTPVGTNAYAAPADGVITSWSFEANASVPQLKFKAARPLTGGDYLIVGESEFKDPTPNTLNTYAIQTPVRTGDVIGFFLNTPGSCSAGTGDEFAEHFFLGDPPPGTTITATEQTEHQLDISANLVTKKCKGKAPTIGGTPGKDTLRGTPGKDVIVGLSGKDTIKGRGGKDRVCGDKGKDTLKGGGGNDFLKGAKGKDTLKGGSGRDKCIGGPGDDTAKKCEVERSI